jgi:multicomponent Na+:H+ antiporter subunit F
MMTLWIAVATILAALIVLSLIRLVKGPTAPDRVVAMDAVNTLVVAGMIVLGIVYQQIIFVDVAIVYALLSFVGTLYIARQLGGKI